MISILNNNTTKNEIIQTIDDANIQLNNITNIDSELFNNIKNTSNSILIFTENLFNNLIT